MNIQTLTVGQLQTNCYIISGDDKNGECLSPALIIDPGAEGERILAALKGREAAAVLLTHGHFDHTGALEVFSDKPIYISAEDAPLLSNPEWSVGARFGDLAPRPKATDYVTEGDRLTLAGLHIEALHTPGHTQGSMCYLIEGALFTGDTLFHRGYGCVTHYGGDLPTELRSVKRLLKIQADLPFYPGHGRAAMLGQERLAP